MMNTSNSKPNHMALFLLIFSIITSFKLIQCLENNTIFCPEIEKQSLLSSKRSFKDPDNLLSSWDVEVNCCQWKGVICNNLTGHVHQLHLRGLSGEISPSLLDLKHLTHLDLSRNSFEVTIPSFIGSFRNLEFLNLSNAGFHGMIPHNIGNLTNLHTLDFDGSKAIEANSLEWLSGLSRLEYLNMNGLNLTKVGNWAQVINTLPSLQQLHLAFCSLDLINDIDISSITFLDLSHNNFRDIAIPGWIFQFQNLLFLDLSFNYFIGPIPAISNATKLQHIDLSRNNLSSTIPDWIYVCKDLEIVHLSDNFLEGELSSSIANLTSLNTFDVFGNQLSGKIPREFSNLCKMEFLLFTYNHFEGELSDSFGNMSECFLRSVKLLCFRSNRLRGPVMDQFGEFKRIRNLHLGGNLFSGPIPDSLGKLSSLNELSLFGNKFTGTLPESFGQLVNLEYLYIDNCMLGGIVTENHFANVTKLKTFSASGNQLTLNVSHNWIPLFQLNSLRVGSWNLELGSNSIPSWIESQKNISELDLSNTGISGIVPIRFWKMKFLNLSHNHFHGEIPYIRGPEYIYLSSNQFSGSLPRVSDNVKDLDVSNNSISGGISHFLCDRTYGAYELKILHLGGNQLSGELPDCWMKWPSLRYLNLGNNNMSGSIPDSIGSLTNLISLNLYRNRFSGRIPFPMQNCTELVKVELSGNNLDGNIPTWIGTSLIKLRILVLRSNRLSGRISSEICHLTSLQILDLSDNKLSGMIPTCVNNLTAMSTERSLAQYDYSSINPRAYFIDSALVATKGSLLQYDTILSLVTNIDLSNNNLSGDIPKEFTSLVELRSLNLSGNQLTGSIPDRVGDMKELESLDLSRNSLSGQIPNSFTLMSSLNYLNLSFNNLTGRIPESTQLLGFDASCFIGNDLCGPPLTSNCSHKKENEDDESEIEWLYVFISLGYAVGFSVVCTSLVLKKSWREAYFEFVECMWEKIYVCVYVKWTGLRNSVVPSL